MGDNGENVDHYCTGEGCGAKVTHKGPTGSIQVLKPPASKLEASTYGSAGAPTVPEKVVESMKYERQT